MEKLEFSELEKGMKVKDRNGNIGTIKKCEDLHNIIVRYKNTGGWGFYCLDPLDENYYDPLYKYDEPVQNI
jgi:hypothetical protein